MKNNTATSFEKDALSKYYFVVSLKSKNYLEYKYKKQEYLLRIDYESVSSMKNEKLINKYKKFYITKMDSLYKGILKSYSVEIADNVRKAGEDAYEKIFNSLENYIMEILPIKIEQGDETAKEEYERYLHTTIGKLDERDKILQKMELLGVSRKIFVHSLPLAATERCYIRLLKQARDIILNSKNDIKKEKAYQTLFDIIEDYNLKLLSTKVYWDKPQERYEFKKFWEQYEKVKENEEKKQILFLKSDLKKLRKQANKYYKIIQFYCKKLVELDAMRNIRNSYISEGTYTKTLNKKKE